jgi:hypothetical protein
MNVFLKQLVTSTFFDSACGTGSCTGTAVDTGIGINYKVIVTF